MKAKFGISIGHRAYRNFSVNVRRGTDSRRLPDERSWFQRRIIMDREGKQKSSLGNDSKLNREKNKVTGVRTSDQLPERKNENDSGANHKPRQGKRRSCLRLSPFGWANGHTDFDLTQSSGFSYVSRLLTLFAFNDFKFHIIAFLQALVSFACDGAEVNKNVWAIRSSDKPVSFCVIEPLYRAFHTFLAYIQSPRSLSLGIRETMANYGASLPNSALDLPRSLAAAFCTLRACRAYCKSRNLELPFGFTPADILS